MLFCNTVTAKSVYTLPAPPEPGVVSDVVSGGISPVVSGGVSDGDVSYGVGSAGLDVGVGLGVFVGFLVGAASIHFATTYMSEVT